MLSSAIHDPQLQESYRLLIAMVTTCEFIVIISHERECDRDRIEPRTS